MAIQILDTGPSLKIVSDVQVRYVMKSAVRELSVIKGDVLKIDVGAGALGNIFLAFSEITFPILASAEQLRDYINNTYLATSNAGSGMADLNATAEKIRQNIDLFRQPLATDDTNPYVIYHGYAAVATPTNVAGWAIQRITQTSTQTITQWAGGNKNFVSVWDNRATLTYQ